ncbi:MAG: DUF4954 family protein [Chitinophagaceae bacterium]|nr:DUF4954 family protein [Chitinophagaceae bacterium]
MNTIKKNPVQSLGYNFIPADFIPKGKNEYYLRNQQNLNGIQYRQLTAYEIEVLVRNRNTSDNWNNIFVSNAFNPELVQNCKFYGLVRIGKLEPFYMEFKNLRRPVGFYNSTIISCDFGDNVVIDNVTYISHYIVGNEVIIINVNEAATTDYAKFGNGIVKDGEAEEIRIWLEVCNENGGRKIMPFDGMLPGDAYLWSRFRDNEILQKRFMEFSTKKFDNRRGYYGTIGDRTVIKNCRILKDVNIGSDAYIKGANKIKNVTINSSAEAMTQIGEGCELVNGIIDHGCRIFYGVKAVRFFMASHSQLKYGARLINSYLGNNSTISCCEVLNSLIFPSHEQHHNNSFLCAALLNGQTNIAAGATIGSNHNSRGADGEMIAGRGFWPGLCVSLKHNSKFASFAILAKGDYPAELNIPTPFSLVSNEVHKNELVVMPGYWFLYNLYALARNSWKYVDRDKRDNKIQNIEFNFLAPDTINEIVHSLSLFQKLTGLAYLKKEKDQANISDEEAISIGKELLESNSTVVNELDIVGVNFENSGRLVRLVKVLPCYHIFKDLISYYAVHQLIEYFDENDFANFEAIQDSLPSRPILTGWLNIGGQLIPQSEIEKLLKNIQSNKIRSWNDVHDFYEQQGIVYKQQKLYHAIAALKESTGIHIKKISESVFGNLLQKNIHVREWMLSQIQESRAKDYENPFRRMVYENEEEMNKILGSLDGNSFIKQETGLLATYRKKIGGILKKMAPKSTKARQNKIPVPAGN